MATQILTNDPAKAKEYFQAKMTFTTGPVELERLLKSREVNIVDVRAAEDYAEGHIPGAVSLPKDKWQTGDGQIPHGASPVSGYIGCPPSR